MNIFLQRCKFPPAITWNQGGNFCINSMNGILEHQMKY